MKRTHLGEFEELVLLMVLVLEEDAYVMKLKDEIHEQIGRSVAMGALHATLSRLEKKSYLESEMKGATQERGGRRKRVYRLTAAGKAAITKAREVREQLWNQIPPLSLEIRYA